MQYYRIHFQWIFMPVQLIFAEVKEVFYLFKGLFLCSWNGFQLLFTIIFILLSQKILPLQNQKST